MVYFQSLEVQDFVAEAGKKGCLLRPSGKKEDEAHFYIHFDIEISPSFFPQNSTKFFLKNRVSTNL